MTQTLSASKATAVAIIATVLALSLALVLATQPAGAEEPATEVATTGEVTSGSGGTSLVVNLGDLKKFPCTTTIGVPCHAGYEVVATDYDDDPGGEPGAPDFYVTPNLGDSPSLRHAWKIVFIDFGGTNDVTAIQKAIRWTAAEVPTAPGPDQNPAGQIVYETVVDVVANPGELLVGQACADFLGDPLTPNTPAHGLVTTDQMAASVLVDLTNRCIQQEVGVHPNNFTVSKHLPPGTYTESITLVYGSNGQAAPFTKDFFVNAVTGYTVDFDLVDWGGRARSGSEGRGLG